MQHRRAYPLPNRTAGPATVPWVAVVLGILVGGSLVGGAWIVGEPQHLQCELSERLGNVSAWTPSVVAPSPYMGSVTGSMVGWTNTSSGGSGVKIPIQGGGGDVETYFTVAFNWTIFRTANVSIGGQGSSSSCNAPLVAIRAVTYAPPGYLSNFTLARAVGSQTDLPWEYNVSYLCHAVFGYRPDCATTATWDINLTSPIGVVDTCGSVTDQTLHEQGPGVPVRVPFKWAGQNYAVPVDWTQWYPGSAVISSPTNPFESSGVHGWYNYTFPANTGSWGYGHLGDMSDGALAFSFTPCPA